MNDTFTGRWYVRSQINDFVYCEHWQRDILIEVATTSHQIVLDIQLKASLKLKKSANSGLFMLISVLFKHNFLQQKM